MADLHHHDFKKLDTYLHDTGAVYISDLLDEMLYILIVYVSDNPHTMKDPAEQFYHLRQLRDLFKELEIES
ncbi:hypothetical protein C900_00669 [Fulvivirga imtechensis AK7]|uniref:Uncharacterized protein n=1 Tax=Fulvivirga imtechensis AK7 TaxID=1237149 RepID=L8JL27_9BACT|nr:hypothetical protein [Fulvivirga imtechensis]ELR68194.1 hypothetical protein C900_00669 [Fulvivirga imtechensis AK7]